MANSLKKFNICSIVLTLLAVLLVGVAPAASAGSHDGESVGPSSSNAANGAQPGAAVQRQRGPKTIPPGAQGKIAAPVLSVLSEISNRGITRANARARDVAALTNPLVRLKQDGRVQVYVHIDTVTDAQLNALRSLELEIEIINDDLAIVQGWAPFDQLENIARRPFVSRVTAPNYGRVRAGSVTTQGDAIHKADQARALSDFDGTGVKVGIISDGANNWPTARASGDLPAAGITTFGGCTPAPTNLPMCSFGLTCNEGTAMAEIVHDMAPGAQIAVGAGIDSSLAFIARVNSLVNTFGADVVVDDLGFFGEPFFADGPIAQAVAAVREQVVFVSSAGNGADGHYEAQYINSGNEFDDHDFGRAAGGSSDSTMNVIIPAGGFLISILQWNDRFGQSGNDYDLWLLDQSGNVLAGSGFFQNGSEDPIEAFCYFNNTGAQLTAGIVVERFDEFASPRRLELFNFGALNTSLGLGIQEYEVPSGSVFGHAAVTGVLAAAAAPASSPNSIEPFSSLGPSRIDFPSIVNRPKPDITGIDGVSVTGTGGFPTTFFGTSASAPHIAAIAALLKQAKPEATPAEIRDAITSNAVDLGPAGRDNTYGWGRADALAAMKVFFKPQITTLPFLMLLLE